MSSIGYYNLNAQSFFDRTVNADIESCYAKFLPHLPKKARILDAGCGSGRDSFYFKKKGFDVLAFDGSIEMVKLSTALLGSPTHHLRFQELSFKEEFDAVWASASLLHVSHEELPSILQKLHLALKKGGIFYASFKYGQGLRKADGRIFTDMDEKSVLPYIQPLFMPLEIWAAPDNRSNAPSPSRAWLKLLMQKL